MSGFCSMFSQLLKLFPRRSSRCWSSARMPSVTPAGSAARASSWAMLFCQLGRAHSLREICGGLRSSEGKLKHLGITAPSRSTLAYANAHRSWQLYRAVFQELLARCQPLARAAEVPVQEQAGESGLHGDRPVRDALRLGPLSADQGCVKLHCLLDHDGYLPSVVVITEASGMTCAWPAPCALPWDHCGHGSGLRGLRVVRAVDHRRGVLRHPPEGQRRVPSGRAAAGPGAQRRLAGRGHRLDRGRGRHGRPAAVAPGRGGRSRQGRYAGLPHEPPRLGGHDDCRHLQGSVADRTVLQPSSRTSRSRRSSGRVPMR